MALKFIYFLMIITTKRGYPNLDVETESVVPLHIVKAFVEGTEYYLSKVEVDGEIIPLMKKFTVR